MKNYTKDAMDQINRYIESVDIETAKENDSELAQTIRMGFIHCLGEIAYAIDNTIKDESMSNDERKQLFFYISDTTRNVRQSLSSLAYIKTVKEVEKTVFVEKKTYFDKIIKYFKKDQ